MDDARPRPSVFAALEREAVVWLSSIRPDGAPHLVPLWFVWDGDNLQARSKPEAQKVHNLREDPRAMVAVGSPDKWFDVELFEAVAELPGTTEVLPEGFATKYEELAAEAGVTLDRFASVYSQPIVLRPTRWIGWGGPGWVPVAAPPLAVQTSTSHAARRTPRPHDPVPVDLSRHRHLSMPVEDVRRSSTSGPG